MKKWIVAAALLAVGVSQAQASDEEKSGLERSADTLLIGIPALALGLTFLVESDRATSGDNSVLGYNVISMTGEPRHDLSLALLRTTVATYGLKAVVDEERPSGKDGAFPSGHTALTFSGAEFIRKEYGWGWGAPAYAAAAFVGWSRVETNDHWWHDVAAGAVIGFASNHDLSDLPTSWGRLSLRASMLSSHVVDAPELHQQDQSAAAGVKIELRF